MGLVFVIIRLFNWQLVFPVAIWLLSFMRTVCLSWLACKFKINPTIRMQIIFIDSHGAWQKSLVFFNVFTRRHFHYAVEIVNCSVSKLSQLNQSRLELLWWFGYYQYKLPQELTLFLIFQMHYDVDIRVSCHCPS